MLLKWQRVVCTFVVTLAALQRPLNDHEFLSINYVKSPVVDVLKCTMKSFSKHWFKKLEFKNIYIYISFSVYNVLCEAGVHVCQGACVKTGGQSFGVSPPCFGGRILCWVLQAIRLMIIHMIFPASVYHFAVWVLICVPLHLTFFILNPVRALSNSGYQAFEASTFTFLDISLFL